MEHGRGGFCICTSDRFYHGAYRPYARDISAHRYQTAACIANMGVYFPRVDSLRMEFIGPPYSLYLSLDYIFGLSELVFSLRDLRKISFGGDYLSTDLNRYHENSAEEVKNGIGWVREIIELEEKWHMESASQKVRNKGLLVIKFDKGLGGENEEPITFSIDRLFLR